MKRPLFSLPVLILAACTSAPGDAGVDCATATGLARDQCLHDELLALPASQPDAVITKAGEISDPMVKHAAVSTWIKAHNNEVPMAKGRELCALLEGRDRGSCERDLSSPHLKRDEGKAP